MITVLLGETNSGKSTIGKAVVQKLGDDWVYVSSGDIARRITPHEDLDAGKFAPEQNMRAEILSMINGEYRNKHIILDGFPRFSEQYEFLHSITSDDILFILVDVPHEQIENRAKNRGRSDDSALNEKFKFWNEHTVPMIKQIIEDHDELYTISNGDNDNVYENVEKVCDILCHYLSQN